MRLFGLEQGVGHSGKGDKLCVELAMSIYVVTLAFWLQVETYRRLAKLASKEDQEGAQYIMLPLSIA